MIEALAEASGRDVSRETYDRLQLYADLLADEAQRQNLISAASLKSLWSRHILDSAQLVRFEPHPEASWADVGSGAGLPGLVVALLVAGPMLLIEPRRLRAAFLERCIGELALAPRVVVAATKVERVSGSFDVITARAVASVSKLLTISTHLSTRKTLWLLPKGRSGQSELAEARRSWQCESTIVPSRTNPESEIVVLRKVEPRGGR